MHKQIYFIFNNKKIDLFRNKNFILILKKMLLECVIIAFSSVVLVVYFAAAKNKAKQITLKKKHVVVRE